MNKELELFFKKIRNDFPILKKKINGKKLVYVDNGATSQKPKQVINSLTNFYENFNSNVHRGVHSLAERATDKYESTRDIVANFLDTNPQNIIFTKGTTDSLNILAHGIKNQIRKGDEIVLTQMEHHANLVPWQELAKITKAKIKLIPITKKYELDLKEAKKLISKKTKIISLTHTSNVLGTINDIKKIRKFSKEALLVIDGAQAIQHQKIDVNKIGCDAYVFSSHKMYGPMGAGVLYISDRLNKLLMPNQFGGDMIEEVFFTHSTYLKSQQRFEAGTPNVADIIAMGRAIEFLNKVGIKKIEKYEKELTKHFLKRFKELKNYKLHGPNTNKNRGPVFSISHNKIHSHDITQILNKYGIATRGGHHCAMPLMTILKVPATTRISLALYNTKEEIDFIIDSLKKLEKIYETGEFLI